ncbi:MAG TPA: 2Fe-2S iron-sulfur cluster-binding protein [Thermoanaerobaculia bacterium]|nr:2Fe-2S iron-sulfur cluster-binding protein [Thermoanaerobaculia bacterium]
MSFHPLGRAEEARTDETLLDAARRAGAPIGNSCGGIGICARCRVRIVAGADQLSAPTSVEARVSAERSLAPDERLACQVIALGDCTITTTYW